MREPSARRMSGLTALAFLAVALASLLTSSGASQAAATKRTGTIAFIRMANGRVFGGSLFVVRPDGSGLRRVTPPSTKVYWYAWSPDGRSIAYIDSRFSLWLIRPDGTGRRLLLPTSRLSSIFLSWSPDGKAIAVSSGGANASLRKAVCRTALYVVPIDGGQPERLAAEDNCDVFGWSPTGDEIAYDHDGIFVMRPDGTGRRRVTQPGSGFDPEWSADGSQLAVRVVFKHRQTGLDVTDRYHAFGVINADGTGYHVVTTHAYNEYGVAWSPEGRRILYGRANGKGIYVVDSDGRNNHLVTRDAPPEAGWGALAWSPTGGSIVYTHTVGTAYNTDLYVIGIDGRDKVRLTNTPSIDIDPTWVAR